MSFFTHLRDFVEDTVTVGLGGSALFGTVGGIAGYGAPKDFRDVLKTIGTGVVGAAFTAKLTEARLPAYRSQLFASQVAPPRAMPIPIRATPHPIPLPGPYDRAIRPPRSVPARYRAFT